MFGKKKKAKEEEKFKQIRKDEIDKVINEVKGTVQYSSQESEKNFKVVSRDYETFMQEHDTKGKPSVYERLANLSEKIISISPDEKSKIKIQRAIELTHMRATPEGAFTFSIFSGVLVALLIIIGAIFGLYSFTTLLFLFILDIVLVYTLFKYPESAAKTFRIQASSEIILAIIYMVIYMRSSPNMEGAVKFAAQNMTGPIAYDLRQLMWDVDIQQTKTMSAALNEYLDRWGEYSEFRESINLLISSMAQPDQRRFVMLDESVAVILNGTKERMAHYSQSLRMPILIIQALGIMLPILVLILFPILILFLSEAVNPMMLVAFYDIGLPLFIFYLSRRVLANRPVSFGAPDISLHPKYSPLGMIKIPGTKKMIKFWPIMAILTGVLLTFSISVLIPVYTQINFTAMLVSLLVPWSLSIGMMIYYFVDSRKKMDIRNQLREMQNEFAEALFRLSGSLSLGTPFEKAIEDAIRKSPDLSITVLFKNALRNVKQGGLSFEAAFFDKKFGAIWEFPSRLVINILKIILEAAKKGVRIAGISAMSISRYMKQLKSIDEDLKDMLSESTTSMKFMAVFLGPFIAGVTVTMAAIMMRIFVQLGEDIGALGTANIPAFSSFFIGGFGQIKGILPVAGFTIIVGIYVIEMVWLLVYLSSGVENGPNDKVARMYSTAWILLIAMVIYSLSIIITFNIFGSQIETLFIGDSL